MRIGQEKIFACDFETTVYEGQTTTEVWRSACVELGTEDVKIFHSIQEQYDYLFNLSKKTNVVCYYHNLKFDGSFWLDYILRELKYEQAVEELNEQGTQLAWLKESQMPNKSFKYSISDMGQWYTLVIKVHRHTITFKDSLKLLPFTLKQIGQAFKTKHQKLEMEYKGYRYAGCEITEDEKQYIANDVLVLKEALEFMFNEGHKSLTIGACCLAEYKRILTKETYKTLMPDLNTDTLVHDYTHNNFESGCALQRIENIDRYIRKSYRGGWCYVVKGKENKVFKNGTTADVNSLYPSMMHSDSGNKYPIGEPTFWYGDYIPEEAQAEDKYYFVHFTCQFNIKDGYLPFIQIKNTFRYKSTDMLETSDIVGKDGTRYNYYEDINGEIKPVTVELTMTMTDYKLMHEHYNVYNLNIIDGCYFKTKIGLFDDYINKYREIKMNSKGAMRQLAKLFLNNLYGKLASSDNSSFKYAVMNDHAELVMVDIAEHNKSTGYIPIGSAITSYRREFTIRARQKNYHGVDQPGFIYADTDSIHCDLKPDEIQGITVDPVKFCCWKLESCWDEGLFVRQKTYIEHITMEDLEICEPYYNVKCAGMPENCKQTFIDNMHDITDLKVGLIIPGKLIPKRIPGGIVLTETDFTLRA